MTLVEFISLLQNIKPDWTAEEIAEILWLAQQLGPSTESEQSGLSAKIKSAPKPPVIAPPVSTAVTPIGLEHLKTSSGDYTKGANRSTTMAEQHSGLPQRSAFRSAELPDALDLSRALHPLREHTVASDRWVLDDVATARRIAEEKIWEPVLVPASSQRLDVDIIIEDSPSMALWEQTAEELCKLLENQKAFRIVRPWRMGISPSGEVKLYAGLRRLNSREFERKPEELTGSEGPHLILLVSDCRSEVWYNPGLYATLENWGKHKPIAIIQMLPQRLWFLTGLATISPGLLKTPAATAPNRYTQVLKLVGYSPRSEDIKGFAIPVVTLEPPFIASWARLIGRGQAVWLPVLIINEEWKQKLGRLKKISDNSLSLSAAERLEDFEATASPLARQLAVLLSASPLNLTLIRHIRQKLLPTAEQIHLAELFLFGLLQEAANPGSKPQDIQYEFLPGVQRLLLNRQSAKTALKVLQEAACYLNQNDTGLVDFLTTLAQTEAAPSPLLGSNLPFVKVAITVFQRLGGAYKSLAGQLEDRLVAASSTAKGESNPSSPSPPAPNVKAATDSPSSALTPPEAFSNPYSFGSPINDPAALFGRRREIRSLLSNLLAESRQNILLVGPRRIGKTSFLMALKAILEQPQVRRLFEVPEKRDRELNRYTPVYFSLQKLSPAAPEQMIPQFFRLLLDYTIDALQLAPGSKERLLELFDRQEKESGALRAAELTFDALFQEKPDMRVLMLLDEYDDIYRSSNAMLGVKLRDLVSQERRITWIFSSTTIIYAESKSSPWFHNLKIVTLGQLEEKDGIALVERPSQGKLEWDSDAVLKLLKATGYRPAYTQIFCREVFNYQAKLHSRYVLTETIGILQRSVIEIEQTLPVLFEDLWRNLRGVPRLILLEVSERSLPLERDDLRRTLLKRVKSELKISPEAGLESWVEQEFQKGMDWLENVADLLTKSPPKQRHYTFSLPLFHDWLLQQCTSNGNIVEDSLSMTIAEFRSGLTPH